MPYDTSNILESEKAYTVLREIAFSEEGSYGKKVAEENDMKQQLASELISTLNDLGIVVKGKRTRAQYYKVDITALIDIFWKMLKEDLPDSDSFEDMIEEHSDMLDEVGENEDAKSVDEQMNEVFPKYFSEYISEYLKTIPQSTIKEMLINDFFKAVTRYKFGAVEAPKWFLLIKELSKGKDFDRTPPEVVLRQAFMSFQEKDGRK